MFLFVRVFGLFYYCFAVFRKGVFFMESAGLLIFGMLVRHKSIICQCQNLVILIKFDVPCGVIFIF